MSIWEVIIYAICGGISELLPMSFTGHAALLRSAFQLTALSEGGGYYIRGAITLGLIIAIILAFPSEVGSTRQGLRLLRRPRRRRRGENREPLQTRTVRLYLFAMPPMLLSFFFLTYAESISRLPYIAGFFALSGFFIYRCCRGPAGQRTERDLTIIDSLAIGFARMLSVFPGLSSVGSSLAVGRAFGIEKQCNVRIAYTLTLGYQIAALAFFTLRAVFYGSFSGGILLLCLLCVLCTATVGYFTLQYARYLLEKNRLNFFAYYCWDAAIIALIVALIDS